MPAVTYVLALEGVLAGRNDHVELTQEGVETVGMALYGPLSRAGRLLLASRFDRRLVDHWLRSNGLVAHAGVVLLDDRVVQRCRAAGETLDLYIDANPNRVAIAISAGVPSMMFTRPMYARQSHRPDFVQPTRQWATIAAEQAAQRAARASQTPLIE